VDMNFKEILSKSVQPLSGPQIHICSVCKIYLEQDLKAVFAKSTDSSLVPADTQ
jgi:hypothetical protein